MCETPYCSHTEAVLSRGVGELPLAMTYIDRSACNIALPMNGMHTKMAFAGKIFKAASSVFPISCSDL